MPRSRCLAAPHGVPPRVSSVGRAVGLAARSASRSPSCATSIASRTGPKLGGSGRCARVSAAAMPGRPTSRRSGQAVEIQVPSQDVEGRRWWARRLCRHWVPTFRPRFGSLAMASARSPAPLVGRPSPQSRCSSKESARPPGPVVQGLRDGRVAQHPRCARAGPGDGALCRSQRRSTPVARAASAVDARARRGPARERHALQLAMRARAAARLTAVARRAVHTSPKAWWAGARLCSASRAG